MDRPTQNCSNLLMSAAVLAMAFLAGCEREYATTYDPRIDGVTSPDAVSAEPGILDDQTKRHPGGTVARVPSTPVAPTTATTTTAPGIEGIQPPPPPPEEGAPATPPAPPETAPPPTPPAAG